MNHVVSLMGLGSLHQAHSTVLPGRRVTSLKLNRGVGLAKDKPSVHRISLRLNRRIVNDHLHGCLQSLFRDMRILYWRGVVLISFDACGSQNSVISFTDEPR